jgi:biopolymer transport protein ExbD
MFMAQGTQDDSDEITGINVTPLVDVMLVLLVIFMVTTTLIVHKTIPVNLPHAATAEDQNTSKNIAFVIDKKGALFLDGTPTDYDHIDAHIAKIKQEHSKNKLQALISADKESTHGEVMRLIDRLRQNGLEDFAINVEALPAPTSTR